MELCNLAANWKQISNPLKNFPLKVTIKGGDHNMLPFICSFVSKFKNIIKKLAFINEYDIKFWVIIFNIVEGGDFYSCRSLVVMADYIIVGCIAIIFGWCNNKIALLCLITLLDSRYQLWCFTSKHRPTDELYHTFGCFEGHFYVVKMAKNYKKNL